MGGCTVGPGGLKLGTGLSFGMGQVIGLEVDYESVLRPKLRSKLLRTTHGDWEGANGLTFIFGLEIHLKNSLTGEIRKGLIMTQTLNWVLAKHIEKESKLMFLATKGANMATSTVGLVHETSLTITG